MPVFLPQIHALEKALPVHNKRDGVNSLPREIAKVAAANKKPPSRVKLQVWQPQAKKQLHVKLWFWQTQSAKTATSQNKQLRRAQR